MRTTVYNCIRLHDADLKFPFCSEVWDAVEEQIALVNTVDGTKAQLETTVKCAWDERFFYVYFACRDDYILSTFTERDSPIYREDVVEIFIAPQIDNRGIYYELELSPTQVVFDAKIFNDGIEKKINVGWDFARLLTDVTDLNNGNMQYQFAIPYHEFGVSELNERDVWAVNFYRIDHKPNGEIEHSAWSPTEEINFHKPEHFGLVHFVSNSKSGKETTA